MAKQERSISAETKQALLAAELAGQPDIAADNDTGEGVAPRMAVKPTGSFEQALQTRTVDVRRNEEQEQELDEEIAELSKKLRIAKVRKAIQPGARRLKKGQDITDRGGKVVMRDTLVGEKSKGEVIRYTNIEHEPN